MSDPRRIELDRQELEAVYELLGSMKKTAKHFGVSAFTVHKRLKEYGMRINSPNLPGLQRRKRSLEKALPMDSEMRWKLERIAASKVDDPLGWT